MPSLTKKLTFLKQKKEVSFSILRRNQELAHEVRNHNSSLRAMIPKITNALRPHPSLQLQQSSSPAGPSTADAVDGDEAEEVIGEIDTAQVVALPATAKPTIILPTTTLPASAVPWPPQTCAGPLSTHHRLACGHVVRTPFLTPCGSNCAHVVVVVVVASSLSFASSSSELASSARWFVVDEFACAVCADYTVRREAAGRKAAFAGMLERNEGLLPEGERAFMVGAHERFVARVAEDQRAELMARGRWCEGAEERDGHARLCP